MIEVVAHDGGRLVQQLCDFGIGLVLEALGEEFGVVAATGLDQELLDRGALRWHWSFSVVFLAGGQKGASIHRAPRHQPS